MKKQELIDEVCDYMEFSPIGKNLYKDNQGVWANKTIEELFFYELDEMDDRFVYDKEPSAEDKRQAKWLLDFCKSAKKFFNVDVNSYIEKYESILCK